MNAQSCYCVLCGKEMPENYIYCPNCGANQRQSIQTQQPHPINHVDIDSKLSMTPIEITSGFNWGAFWGGWIWGLGNKVRFTLIQLVLMIIQITIILTTRSYMAASLPGIINFAFMVVLGVNGNVWAWQSRRYESVDQFKAVQHRWALCMLATYVLLQVVMTFVWRHLHIFTFSIQH